MSATLTLFDAFTGNPAALCLFKILRMRVKAHGSSPSSTALGAQP